MRAISAFSQTLRVWRRSPGLAVCIVTLAALGISGVTALSTSLYALVLKPLDFPQPHQLVRIGGGLPVFNAYTKRLDHQERLAAVFTSITAYAPVEGPDAELAPAGGESRGAAVLGVTPRFAETLGVRPHLGRSFAGEPPDAPVALISARLWKAVFAGSDDVIGQTIRIGRRARTIVGVLPEGFDFPGQVDAYVLLGTTPYRLPALEVIGRLRPEFSLESAAAALKAMGFQRVFGPTGQVAKDGAILQDLRIFLSGDARPTLVMLWAASLLFLLVACIGIANLLIAHGVRRHMEFAVCRALGAARRTLILQLLRETLALAIAGGAIGVWLSAIAARWLSANVLGLDAVHPFGPGALAIVTLLIVLVTLVCGVVPALRATRMPLSAVLNAGSGRISGVILRRGTMTSREWLAAAQLATAMALLIAAGLLGRSLAAQLDRPLGVDPEGVAVFDVQLETTPALVAARAQVRQLSGPAGQRRDPAASARSAAILEPARRGELIRNAAFQNDALARVASMPGVAAAGVLNPMPFTPDAFVRAHLVAHASRADESPSRRVRVLRGQASPTAFEVLGIPLIAGRPFSAADIDLERAANEARHSRDIGGDRARGIPEASVIVNEALAEALWGGEDPIGRRLTDTYSAGQSRAVVGVVGNFLWTENAASGGPALYYPLTGETGTFHFAVKLHPGTSVDGMTGAIDAALRALSPGLPRTAVHSLAALTEQGLRDLRLAAWLVFVFSALGSMVALLGVYAASTLMAAARMREMGIRIALGASGADIRRHAVMLSVRPLLAAVPVGLAGAWVLARQLAHLLVDVSSIDPVIYLGCSGGLVVAAFAASVMPLLRAGQTSPGATLRHE